MKKSNLLLLVLMIMLSLVVVSFISNATAEDTKTATMKVEKDKGMAGAGDKCACSAMAGCGDPNCGTGKPCHCGEKCTCSAMASCGDPNCGTDKPCKCGEKCTCSAMASCGDPNCGTGKPCHCGEKCTCSAMKKDQGTKCMCSGSMVCPMMQKKMASSVEQIMANADKLQLTQEQKDKIENLMLNFKKDMIKKKAELDLASIDLEELMKKESPDLKAVAEQIRKVSGLEADLKFSEFAFNVNVKALLTNEQKDTLKMPMKHSQ